MDHSPSSYAKTAAERAAPTRGVSPVDLGGAHAFVGRVPQARIRSGVRPSLAPFMRLVVARCEVRYSGRLSAVLPEALRLIMVKSDGSVMVHADTGGYKPQNWMTPPTVIEESDDAIVVRKRAGTTEDRLDIRIAEVVSDVTHDMGEALAAAPECCGEGFRLVRREWPTDIGPVDLMCRDGEDGWIAVEIKRVATIEAVEQLCRYLERIRLDPAMGSCRGVLAAQAIKP